MTESATASSRSAFLSLVSILHNHQDNQPRPSSATASPASTPRSFSSSVATLPSSTNKFDFPSLGSGSNLTTTTLTSPGKVLNTSAMQAPKLALPPIHSNLTNHSISTLVNNINAQAKPLFPAPMSTSTPIPTSIPVSTLIPLKGKSSIPPACGLSTLAPQTQLVYQLQPPPAIQIIQQQQPLPTATIMPMNQYAVRTNFGMPQTAPANFMGKMMLPIIKPYPPNFDRSTLKDTKNQALKKQKESHNEVERRRRENINQIISELATLVPETHPGQPKGVILRKTADYIREINLKIQRGELSLPLFSSKEGADQEQSSKKRDLDELENGEDNNQDSKRIRSESPDFEEEGEDEKEEDPVPEKNN